MTYTLDDSRLRMVRQISKEDAPAKALANARLLVLEHILPTTEEFIKHIVEAGAEVFRLLAKPYSIDSDVLDRLRTAGVRIDEHTYKQLDESDILDNLLQEAIAESRNDGRKIIIVDVGGYFAAPLCRLKAKDLVHLCGVVEDTTFGHNRYVASIQAVPIPVFSVARSALKEIEARFVGKDAVSAMDHVLRREGISLPGRNALVIGYGMIGKNVARSLSATDLRVSVYDIQDHKNLAAFADGYRVHTKADLLSHADMIFVATGNPKGALSFREIEDCKPNVILVSVGSRDTEIDVHGVNRQALTHETIGPHLIRYKLHNHHDVVIARNGTAINFVLPSIPVEVLDLVFSEILSGVISLLENPDNFPPGKVHDSSDDLLGVISKGWLRFVNR